MLQTERLFLVTATLPMLEAVGSEDWPSLSSLLGGVDFAENWSRFPEAMIWMRDFLREHPEDLSWWCYLIVHRYDARLIGTCGYKGAPSMDGTVEIGYEIADAYQGRGFATEAAAALMDYAFRHDAVKAVVANTLAEENPSVGILRKLGFQFVAEHIDIEDGLLWEWRSERSSGQ